MTLTKAKLVRRTTLDGWGDVVNDDVPLGKTYWVDLNRIEKLQHGQDGRPEIVMRDFIWAEGTEEGAQAGWFPLEMLEMENVN